MLELTLLTILSVIAARVWFILIQPEFLLDFMGPVIERIKYPKLQKLMTCTACMAGQIALWSYIVMAYNFNYYNPIHHLSCVICAIWLAAMENKLHDI